MKQLSYPFVRCEVTGVIRPGYALCLHLAQDTALEVADMIAPTKKSMGVMVCAVCKGSPAVALVVCCGPCVEAGLLKVTAQA